ncbi:PEP-CTERM sorting domain-containing protein [Methylomonas sp. SURF-1]|uniref:PEP-CTERM sorting domain-containing protein n=1 Tax=Methylomonas aurea TaxID=2952224 RepID=A0ABT1UH96_9GAMM|nr:exosortase-dependent surface protein XDP1 [Methylomonas sp. SURF-1]MCQ8181590.1 PEP-CTERM sorting domain-containing protein [Methylomonas sp. SURF-1]
MTRKYLAITALLLAPLAASATTWSFNGTGTTVPSGIKSIQAFSINSGNTTFSTATSWTAYSGGIGVKGFSSESTAEPQHATDNNGNLEAILFRFDESTILDKLSIGWPSTIAYDSDISVLRYIGTVDSTGALPSTSNISGESISQLLSRGWEFVGSYNTVKGTEEDINPDHLSSSYWLISAYSSSWGSGKGETTQVDNGNDYFKLLSLTSGAPGTTPGTSVPEPTSLLLLAGGMLGWRLNRKNQALAA